MNKKYYSFGNPFKVRHRKHYCYKCGTELTIIKHSKVVTKKSEEAKYYDFSAGAYSGVMVGSCEFIHNVFYCSTCLDQTEFVTQLSFEDIDIYIKKLKQKFLKKGINLEIKKSYEVKSGNHVDKVEQFEDIQYLCLTGYQDSQKLFMHKISLLRKNCWERPYYFKIAAKLVSTKQINKLRWILLFPIIGGFICMYYIFNSKLSEKTNSKDVSKLLSASTIVLIGVAFIIKIVLSMFKHIEFLDNYKTLIMLIPSLLSFNLPVLWYINHKFR